MSKGKNPFAFLSKIDLKCIPAAINTVTRYGKQHAPSILTVIGIGGFWYAGISGAIAYKEALDDIDDQLEERMVENEEREKIGKEPLPPLDRVDKIKIIAKHEAKSLAVAGISTFCVAKANDINLSRLAGMTTLYYSAKGERDAIINRVENGETDELKRGDLKRARQAHNAERYEQNPVVDQYDIYDTHTGNTLFVETFSGEKFYSSVTAVNTAITQMNTALQEEGYLLLDDFYDMLGISSRTKNCGKYHAFRYSGKHDVIHPNQILDWQDYTDPVSGEPRICFINFERFLTPSDEYSERSPW